MNCELVNVAQTAGIREIRGLWERHAPEVLQLKYGAAVEVRSVVSQGVWQRMAGEWLHPQLHPRAFQVCVCGVGHVELDQRQ